MRIAAEQPAASDPLGTLDMRERPLLPGGDLAIQAASGGGTTVNIRIPEAHRRIEGVTP